MDDDSAQQKKIHECLQLQKEQRDREQARQHAKFMLEAEAVRQQAEHEATWKARRALLDNEAAKYTPIQEAAERREREARQAKERQLKQWRSVARPVSPTGRGPPSSPAAARTPQQRPPRAVSPEQPERAAPARSQRLEPEPEPGAQSEFAELAELAAGMLGSNSDVLLQVARSQSPRGSMRSPSREEACNELLQLQREAADLSREPQPKPEVVTAVAMIQAAARGHKARRMLVPARQQRANAAIKLQANFRGWVARAEYRDEWLAAEQIQAAFRGWQVRASIMEQAEHLIQGRLPVLVLPDKAARRRLFDQLDANGNNGLSLAKIDKAVMEGIFGQALGVPAFNHKLALIRALKAAEISEDGFIERSEFSKVLSYLVYLNNLWHKFDEIDSDHDRRMNAEEFATGCATIGLELSSEEAAAEFAVCDTDGGGETLFVEFCAWCAQREAEAVGYETPTPRPHWELEPEPEPEPELGAPGQSLNEAGSEFAIAAAESERLRGVRAWGVEALSAWVTTVLDLGSIGGAIAQAEVDGATALEMLREDWVELGATGLQAAKVIGGLKRAAQG